MQLRDMFFEDVAKSMDYWVREMAAALVDGRADWPRSEDAEPFRRIQDAIREYGITRTDIEAFLRYVLRGFAISVLTTFDGGTDLATRARLAIVDQHGEHLGEGLHDLFVSHLLETGRMK